MFDQGEDHDGEHFSMAVKKLLQRSMMPIKFMEIMHK